MMLVVDGWWLMVIDGGWLMRINDQYELVMDEGCWRWIILVDNVRQRCIIMVDF